MSSDIERLQERLRAFSAERDWDQYHTPKNLATALAGEAGELLAEFQWLTPDEAQAVMEDADKAAAVRDELADVAIYLLRLADVLDVDLAAAADAKIDRNERRFTKGEMVEMLTESQLYDLWGRIWEAATDESDAQGRRRHSTGIKWYLESYGVTVREGAGPHGPVRVDALARLEEIGAIERIGGGQYGRTKALWVAPPPK